MFNNLSLPSLASIAREKLHGTATPGAKDDARLYRWVLLKNSLTNALSRSSDTHPPPTKATPPVNKVTQQPAQTSSIDDVDAFLFPDGDVFADIVEDVIPIVRQNSKDELESEARWLDSLLESLGDDEADADALVSVVPVEQEEEEYEDSDLASLLDLPSCEDLPSTSSLSISPESILLPPSPPFNPVDYESSPPLHIHTFYGSTPPPVTCLTYGVSDLCDDIDALALPDVIEDSSSDTDSDSLNTPYNRSISSLSDNQLSQFVTPRPSYVRIFNADDDVPVSNLPHPSYDFQSHVPLHVIDPFHQEC